MQFSDLDKDVRAPLRTLSKDNAESVGRHLAMVVRLIDSDPERAYEHAQEAVRSAGRVDIVREAAGLTAYRTGRYAEALRELRTVRRLNGSSEHLPIMADCERGLGRPERAIALAASPEAETLDVAATIELAIVVAGARMDLGDADAAKATLDSIDVSKADKIQKLRVLQAKAGILDATGHSEEGAALLKGFSKRELAAANGGEEYEPEVVAFDLSADFDEEFPAEEAPAEQAPAEQAPETEKTVAHAPVSEEPAVEASAAETPAAGTPAVETDAVEPPSQDAPSDVAPAAVAPVDGGAAEETSTDEALKDETAAQVTPVGAANENADSAEKAPEADVVPEHAGTPEQSGASDQKDERL